MPLQLRDQSNFFVLDDQAHFRLTKTMRLRFLLFLFWTAAFEKLIYEDKFNSFSSFETP